MRKFYLAAMGGSGSEVSTIEQMETALKNGFSIIECDGKTETVIADPERGWLTDKPKINGPKICKAPKNEAEEALNIILYGEE